MRDGRDWTNLTWGDQTWGERAKSAISFILAAVIGLGMFVGGILVLGSALDGVDRYNSEHDRCLKQAMNGYEIKRCN